jgi:hypothetical protein
VKVCFGIVPGFVGAVSISSFRAKRKRMGHPGLEEFHGGNPPGDPSCKEPGLRVIYRSEIRANTAGILTVPFPTLKEHNGF